MFQKNNLFHPEMIPRPLFSLKIQKITGKNSLKQKKLIFNFFVNRNWKKLTDSRKRAKILADNRKSHHPIEILLREMVALGGSTVQRRSRKRNQNAVFTKS